MLIIINHVSGEFLKFLLKVQILKKDTILYNIIKEYNFVTINWNVLSVFNFNPKRRICTRYNYMLFNIIILLLYIIYYI